MAALDVPYETYVELFGERCGICGRRPTDGKKLRRDHSHKGDGRPRGLLCWRHNVGLQMFGDDDPDLLRAAAAYLERAADRDGEDDYGSRASTPGIDQEAER
jgi:hypothetical protein